MREPRSIIFYAWAGIAAQALLVAGVIAFVLSGAAYQRSAITELHNKVQVLSVANLTMQSNFIDAQRAVGGYQSTGQPRFLRLYNVELGEFYDAQHRLMQMAPASFHRQVAGQARVADAAFAAYGQATREKFGSRASGQLYSRALALSDEFLSDNDHLRQALATNSNQLTSKAEQILGVGLGWTTAILAFGLMVPVAAGAVALRWVSGPLHGVTHTVRRRALGDHDIRAVPGGPADVRDLAASINLLADENDRIREAERERVRLLAEVHQAAIRIRQHLHGQAVVREAVTAIREHLAVDLVWVGLISAERLTLAGRDEKAWGQVDDFVEHVPPDSVGWLQAVYQHRSSYRIQNLNDEEAEGIPAEIREVLLRSGAVSLLLTPFGVGPELLGCLTLSRDDPDQFWTPAEVEAVESLAGDIGRGMEHARLYEGEERIIEELKSVDRAKAGFIAAASHDLRTPLTSIIGYVELLSDGEAGLVNQGQIKMLEAIDRNARRLKTLVEDVLTISKIELGAFTSRLEPVDLATLVWASADVIRPSAGFGGLSFEVICPDKGLMVDGDAEQIDRVLVNLLSNAVKYTPRGGSVSLALTRERNEALLTVADTGIGVPEADQASLFTRFFRASNAVARELPGSGLGLSIVRTIVTNHHGQIGLDSAEGQGTTVTVRLPLRPEALVNGAKRRKPAARTGRG